MLTYSNSTRRSCSFTVFQFFWVWKAKDMKHMWTFVSFKWLNLISFKNGLRLGEILFRPQQFAHALFYSSLSVHKYIPIPWGCVRHDLNSVDLKRPTRAESFSLFRQSGLRVNRSVNAISEETQLKMISWYHSQMILTQEVLMSLCIWKLINNKLFLLFKG